MNELALFTGAGGCILGSHLLGWTTVCAVEINDYARRVLLARQADGCLPRFPVWDDVTTFGGNPWRGRIDVVSGGFPCQDISAAGKGAGIDGARSGLWREFARIIGEVRPCFVFVENSPMLTVRGLGRVLGDLATLGYNAEWGVVSAADVGGEHVRERLFILAHTDLSQQQRGSVPSRVCEKNSYIGHARWGKDKPGLDRMANGVASRMDRLAAIGNGQVPAVVRLAWCTLYARVRGAKAN